jgi:hypothetical protein
MEKIFWLVTERYSYTVKTSLGRMSFQYDQDYVHNPPQPIKEFFGNTLEDAARPGNVKIYGETCLPGGLECDVSLFENEHYGKTIIFHTETDNITIKFGPLTWTWCLAHGGSDAGDTLGCVLVAKNIIDKDHIQGSLKDALRKKIEEKIAEGYAIKARFINLSQTK